ncbi:MAG: hypothetical protein SVU88_04170, partial [Candidatus Nanohaloarchaea archaeon]|nr:hypothetical protein [Candidatus Nanohaloarchaea archaeon]
LLQMRWFEGVQGPSPSAVDEIEGYIDDYANGEMARNWARIRIENTLMDEGIPGDVAEEISGYAMRVGDSLISTSDSLFKRGTLRVYNIIDECTSNCGTLFDDLTTRLKGDFNSLLGGGDSASRIDKISDATRERLMTRAENTFTRERWDRIQQVLQDNTHRQEIFDSYQQAWDEAVENGDVSQRAKTAFKSMARGHARGIGITQANSQAAWDTFWNTRRGKLYAGVFATTLAAMYYDTQIGKYQGCGGGDVLCIKQPFFEP